MSSLGNALAALMEFTFGCYRFGFQSVGHYLLVGIPVGIFIGYTADGGITWEDLKRWGLDQTFFFTGRFFIGLVGWPLFAWTTPMIVPIYALFAVAIVASVVLGWIVPPRPQQSSSN